MSLFRQWRANALHREGCRLSDQGDKDRALEVYARALSLDPHRSSTHYNIGLIHKYRQSWAESFDHNQRAYSLAPGDEAVQWNLAIAATALGDWATSRSIWSKQGWELDGGEGPIRCDFGLALVRLNPRDDAEVVWVERVDPVSARIVNVPFQTSGYFYHDIVLHDGAQAGERVSGDTTYPVFNAFRLLERSQYQTRVISVESPSQMDLDLLFANAETYGIHCEDWSHSVRWLCKACSEGLVHEDHQATVTWNPVCELACAVLVPDALDRVLTDWAASPGRKILSAQ